MFKLLFLGIIYVNAYLDDKVKRLPGVHIGEMSLYSGYLKVGETGRSLHYMFVESQNDPLNSPVLLWLNGGPGCSSLDGLFAEIGPFTFKHENGSLPKPNPNSWNRVANILFFESPSIVGFSLNPAGIDQFTYDDKTTAEDNYAALRNFFNEKFPQYKKNPFWIAGESYAGIYIPTLAVLIDNNIQKEKINLQGIMIGNGVQNIDDIIFSQMNYLANRNFIQKKTLRQFYDRCLFNFNRSKCQTIFRKTSNLVQYINPYNVYDYCWYEKKQLRKINPIISQIQETLKHQKSNHRSPQSEIPCVYIKNFQDYFNRLDVKIALHVDVQIKWNICVFNKQFHYKRGKGSLHYIKELEGKYKILIYSGDGDSVISNVDTIKGLKKLKLKSLTKYRSYIDREIEQLVGFTQKFENNITFATIRGAGHMVPSDKPKQAFLLFNKTINHEEL